MNIHCVIVEDEPLARKLLTEYINSTPNLRLEKAFGNPLEALEYLGENEIDLLFSDIQMKEITGLTLLKLLKKKPMVVLTTAYSQYALEGYELDVVDYLLKPISFERFLKATEKVKDRLQNSETVVQKSASKETKTEDYIFVKDGSKLLKVQLSDILYIKSLKDYVRIITTEKQIVSLQTMKSLEEALPKSLFIRIHNSIIVAFTAIEEIERDAVKIGSEYLSISDSYKQTFKKAIASKRV